MGKKHKKGRSTPKADPYFRVERDAPADKPFGATHGMPFEFQSLYLGEGCVSLLVEPSGTCEAAGGMVLPHVIVTTDDGIIVERHCLHCAIEDLNASPWIKAVVQ